jgi:hypothetical protein
MRERLKPRLKPDHLTQPPKMLLCLALIGMELILMPRQPDLWRLWRLLRW